MVGELLPAFVVLVERVEEGHGIGDVHDHGQVQARCRRPEGVEPLVVHRYQPALRVASAQAERLPDLDAAGTHPGCLLEALRFHEAEVGPLRPLVTGQPAEVDEARGVLATVPRDAFGKPGTLLHVEVDDGLHAGFVEGRQELGDGARVPAIAEGRPQVVVGVDDREARPLDAVLGQAQAAQRPVVDESHVVRDTPHDVPVPARDRALT